jgi:hypothetical protein
MSTHFSDCGVANGLHMITTMSKTFASKITPLHHGGWNNLLEQPTSCGFSNARMVNLLDTMKEYTILSQGHIVNTDFLEPTLITGNIAVCGNTRLSSSLVGFNFYKEDWLHRITESQLGWWRSQNVVGKLLPPHATNVQSVNIESQLAYNIFNTMGVLNSQPFTMPPNHLFEGGVHNLTNIHQIRNNWTLFGSECDVFIFQIGGGGEFRVHPHVHIILQGGVQSTNIVWQVEPELHLGEKVVFVGNIFARGSVVLFPTAVLVGRVFAHGNVLLNSNTITPFLPKSLQPRFESTETVFGVPTDPNVTLLKLSQPSGRADTLIASDTDPTLWGELEHYTVICGGALSLAASVVASGNFVASGATSVGVSAIVYGNIDVVGAMSIGVSATVNGLVHAQAAFTVATAGFLNGSAWVHGAFSKVGSGHLSGRLYGTDVPASQNAIMVGKVKLAYKTLWKIPPDHLGLPVTTTSLTPGVYYHGSAWALTGGHTITFRFHAVGGNTRWTLKILGAVAVNGHFSLGDGVLPHMIQWVVAGAFSVAVGSNVIGTIMSMGAISVGADGVIIGRAFTCMGAVSIGVSARIGPFEIFGGEKSSQLKNETYAKVQPFSPLKQKNVSKLLARSANDSEHSYHIQSSLCLRGFFEVAGDPSMQSIFHIHGNLSVADNTHLIIIGNLNPLNILWIVDGSVTVGVNATLAGTIVAGQHITFQSNAQLVGSLYTKKTITLCNNSVSEQLTNNQIFKREWWVFPDNE